MVTGPFGIFEVENIVNMVVSNGVMTVSNRIGTFIQYQMFSVAEKFLGRKIPRPGDRVFSFMQF